MQYRYSRGDLLSLHSKTMKYCCKSLQCEKLRKLGIHVKKRKHFRGRRARRSKSKPKLSIGRSNKGSDRLLLHVLNVRSLRNKPLQIREHIEQSKCDLLAVTETWLKTGDEGTSLVSDLCPINYGFLHVPRPDDSGYGGLAVIFSKSLKLRLLETNVSKFATFEVLAATVTSDSETGTFVLFVIYRPPPSATNNFTFQQFYDDFYDFLEDVVLKYDNFILTGDLNVHFDKVSDSETKQVAEMLRTFDLRQTVEEATHRAKHTLDVVIVPSESTLVSSLSVQDHAISDHYTLCATLSVPRPSIVRTTFLHRKFSLSVIESISAKVQEVFEPGDQAVDVSEMVEQYNNHMRSIIDEFAPEKRKTLAKRSHAPWFSDKIIAARKVMRKAERRWRRTGLLLHRALYVAARTKVTTVIGNTKRNYYCEKIEEGAHDQKSIFRIVNSLTGKIPTSPQPSAIPGVSLSERFSNFFRDKIEAIRLSIAETSTENTSFQENPTYEVPIKDVFEEATEKEVYELIRSCPPKSCMLDPLPTWVLKKILPSLVPFLTGIINSSISNGTVPEALKTAIVRPLLKKHNLDANELKNYRPVSNLPFLSKILEKVVSARLKKYLGENQLYENFQSAYRQYHGTETALVRVQSDILEALDKREVAALILLDLSAAFDTIDHDLLLNRLSCYVGVHGDALRWFKSYLQDRTQVVGIGDSMSSSVSLRHGVPQGSVLGPMLFCIYMLPLGNLIRSHGISFHAYADDTQLYQSFQPKCQQSTDEVMQTLENCIASIQKWMSLNFLKLNAEKTEFVLLKSRWMTTAFAPSTISIGTENITASSTVRNLGVLFDSGMSMEDHITSVCRRSFMALRCVSSIRKYLTREAAQSVVHAMVTSRLDYCNALLYNVPLRSLNRLQRIQNTAARIVSGAGRRDHITPVLKDLHWLPINQRINFKLLCLVYKGLHGMAPVYLSELLREYVPSRSLRSEDHTAILCVPRTSTKSFGDRSFRAAAPKLWNMLPENLRSASSFTTFHRHLKAYLFTLAYP